MNAFDIGSIGWVYIGFRLAFGAVFGVMVAGLTLGAIAVISITFTIGNLSSINIMEYLK